MAAIPGGEALHTLVGLALSYGITELRKPEGLAVSLLEEAGTGERTLTRFTTDKVDAGVRAARKKAAESGAERVAVCWDGKLSGPDGDFRAVMALAQERGQPSSLVFAQRYSFDGAQVEVIGAPGYAGDRKTLFP